MITNEDIALAHLILYYKDQQDLVEIENKIIQLERMVGVKSPNFTDVHGYGGTRDEKLTTYSEKLEKLEEEKRHLENSIAITEMKLRLADLPDVERKLLELIIKDKVRFDEVAKMLNYTNKSYVSRKQQLLLEKIGKYF